MSDLKQLQKAIESGDSESAKSIVMKLASQKISLRIEPKLKDDASIEENIRIALHIESLENQTLVQWEVKPSNSIKDLKERLERDFEFPQKIQRWIIGQKICEDEETLTSNKITSNGAEVFVYLLKVQRECGTRDSTVAQDRQDAAREPPREIQNQPEMPRLENKKTWQCPKCTFKNEFLRPGCEQCTTPRPKMGEDNIDNEPENERILEMPAPHIFGQVGWACESCTFVNEPTRPGCELCGDSRPEDYEPPKGFYVLSEAEQRRLQQELEAAELARLVQEQERIRLVEERTENYHQLLEHAKQRIVYNKEVFHCAICYDEVPPGGGVILRECLHQFCSDCLEGHIEACEEAQVSCPHQDEDFACDAVLLDIEIRSLVSAEQYEKYKMRSLQVAEGAAANSYHCKTPDCLGWCYYDDDVNFFPCQNCGKQNCLTCKAIHIGQNCKEYQEDLRIKAQNDVDARKTQEALEKMLLEGEAMKCPQCGVIITKKEGCDWLRCSVCKTEICWVTRGRRWGPQGQGDISGGCKCRVNGQPCHPNCQNCH